MDFLNRAVISHKDIEYSTGDEIKTPKWFPLKLTKSAPPSGEILLSFAICANDFNFRRNVAQVGLERMITMREFNVNLNILGLRNLQSPGILPVKKAFISFNLQSLVPPKIGTSLRNLVTEPRAPGANPTINTLMSFKVPLPTDPLYCPRLSCQVFDNVFSGFSQPMIGSFTIPIGDLVAALKAERDSETAELEKIVEYLKKISSGDMVASYYADQDKIKTGEGIAEENDDLDNDMKEQRMKDKQKAKLLDEFDSSINPD